MHSFFKPFFRLLRLSAQGPAGRFGVAQFVFIFVLSLGGLAISIRLIRWSNDFYNALQEVNGTEILHQIGLFVLLTAASASLYLLGKYVQNLLEIRWRKILTQTLTDQWLAQHNHWQLSLYHDRQELDNPDQRIAEDCHIFIQLTTTQGLALIMAIISVVSYFSVLWSLSTFALHFSVLGWDIHLPRYMVWAAPIYVLISSGMTHWLGSPLKRLTMRQQHREADFRSALIHVRNQSEAIALQRGETAERSHLQHLFSQIEKNWRQLNIRQLILGGFTRPYYQTVLRIPMFLALPAFIAGKVTLGGLMQLASAFSSVVTTLSWFIFSYKDLAELAAATRRLEQLLQRLHGLPRNQAATLGRHPLSTQTAPQLHLNALQLYTPNGTPLLHVPKLSLSAGERLWLQGPSGIGKSTLLKAIAGLWPFAQGQIQHPEPHHALYLPQQPYIPTHSLKQALCYPDSCQALNSVQATHLLNQVGLPKLIPLLHSDLNQQSQALERLSGGEKQRLALARALWLRPQWLFLDEATSALDQDSEQQLLQLLDRELAQSGLVLLSHRQPQGLTDYQHQTLTASVDSSIVKSRSANQSSPTHTEALVDSTRPFEQPTEPMENANDAASKLSSDSPPPYSPFPA